MKKNYTICIVKEGKELRNSWELNYNEVKSFLDVIWSGEATENEIRKIFNDEIHKQVEYNETNNISKWRAMKLYDNNGKQIAQES